MTNYPAHRHALALFRACPDLDLGIHLSLTDGHPVTETKTIIPISERDFSFRGNLSCICARISSAPALRLDSQ